MAAGSIATVLRDAEVLESHTFQTEASVALGTSIFPCVFGGSMGHIAPQQQPKLATGEQALNTVAHGQNRTSLAYCIYAACHKAGLVPQATLLA